MRVYVFVCVWKVWFLLYGAIYVSFYFFTSPFVGNPELLNSWTPYVYLSMGLYGWLFAAAALHAPFNLLGLQMQTIKTRVTLLFPFFSTSFVILVLLELLMVLLVPRVARRMGFLWKLANVTLIRSFMNVLRNSAAISVACVVLIAHCDGSVETTQDTTEAQTYKRHACETLFDFSRSSIQIPVPATYRGAILIWFAGMVLAITNFVLERMSGIRVISFPWMSDKHGEEDPLTTTEHLHEKLPPNHNLSMVPWYSMFLFNTAFELLISLKVFLGRFDQRALQRALYPNDSDYYFDHLAERKDLWLDFMADCGDGFNSSYQIARLLAQPEIEVDCRVALPRATGLEKLKRRLSMSGPPAIKRKFPRADVLVIGGDLAYPHPNSETYESRFWRCFEYAMKPPSIYDPANISIGEPTLPDKCKSLKDYEGPSVFAVPGNHDWFDGLNTFTRFICHRDWLGGWLLPQKTSHFVLKLPHGWWLFGVDLALEDDVNTEQFALFQRVVESRMGPDDAVIIVTHEPRWLLDVYESTDKSEEKLSYLIKNILKDRVAVRLAGDIHNYTRHSLVHDDSTKTRRPSADQSARSQDNHHKTPPTSPRRSPRHLLSPTRKHFPHMYDDDKPEAKTAPTEGARSKRPRPAEHLIVSGGGGAFLHPTHAPRCNNIKSYGANYKQEACYPPVHVSERYALLNVFGFRRINWRFDIIGGLGYFAIVCSMFPRCSVSQIYASPTWSEAAVRFAAELLQVLYEMVAHSYISLATCVGMVVVLTVFADCNRLWKKCATGIVVSLVHCIAAFTILLVFECMFEIATVRGLLGREGSHSLYHSFTSALPDFSVLAAYDVLNLHQLYAVFLKYCMTIFDVPEVAAIHRIKICESGFDTLSRMEVWAYYLSVFPYFWVLATPVVAAVFGIYLYVSLGFFECHYNEAFSALRISSYKNFLRLHFDANGDLEVFAFGIDKMPRKWCRDPDWSGGSHKHGERDLPSYKWPKPSYWKPVATKVDNFMRIDLEDRSFDAKVNVLDRSNVHLIDYVRVAKTRVRTWSG
ncbi:TPA: hypothetical protein N0F65_003138 [Lagenidium giganteum]|uniref:Calcineurin-like phosphoesterase domain-containing protein n=1 Tax=Lagenidium giganteum TaxID=4803 RepID=A0AAV2YIS2_9STRA|nr:TPA: hypothetical protein N0F65_003138 [Lagenidium giganteum]